MRPDGDFWNTECGVGSLDLQVAAARAMAARGPDPLAVDPFAEIFLRAAGGEWAALLDHAAADNPLTDNDFGVFFQELQAARIHYFDHYLRDATQSGLRQVVIVAAGLDARAYRLSWPDDTVVYEVDRPAVLEFKQRAISGAGHKPRTERREVPVDPDGAWPPALRECGFDPRAGTAWLIEGLLPYLSTDSRARLFESVDALSASGSRIAADERGVAPPEVIAAAEAESGAGGDWIRLIYSETHTEAATWFAARGWTSERIALLDYLARHGRLSAEPGEPTAPRSLAGLITAVRP